MLLEPLPYEQWEPTKTTVHLWSQIVGKVALACAPPLNHWWSIRLRPTDRGLSTHLLRHGDIFFAVHFDFLDHVLVIETTRIHEPLRLPLRDGLSVAEFYTQFFALLAQAGIELKILAKPYGVPMTTPFANDREHASYDAQMVRRWWHLTLWSADVMERFAATFAGKQSTPEVFWHTFDLAMGRYSGRRAPGPPKSDKVQQEAYSHEVIAFGFWAGDANVPDPTFYTYTAPEPGDLAVQPLQPSTATWIPSGSGHLGVVPYETIRLSSDPSAALTSFFESGYRAGVKTAGWDAAQYTR